MGHRAPPERPWRGENSDRDEGRGNLGGGGAICTHAGRNYRSGAAVLQTQGHLSPLTSLLYAEMGVSSLQQVTRNPEGTEITGEPPEAFPGGTPPLRTQPQAQERWRASGREVPAEVGRTRAAPTAQAERAGRGASTQTEVTPGGPPTQRREPPGESCAPELSMGTGTSCICAVRERSEGNVERSYRLCYLVEIPIKRASSHRRDSVSGSTPSNQQQPGTGPPSRGTHSGDADL